MATHSDYFTNYTEDDLKYEFNMLQSCKNRKDSYKSKDTFLYNLCIEGWLLHTRRIIEAFELTNLEGSKTKWKKLRSDIAQHLSHSKSTLRHDPDPKKHENPKWNIDFLHKEMIDDLKKVADQHKEYVNYNLLLELLDITNDINSKK